MLLLLLACHRDPDPPLAPVPPEPTETAVPTDTGTDAPTHTGSPTFWDLDGDGAGVADCDDTDPTVFPGAPDALGDGVDHDCDGTDGFALASALGPWPLGEFGLSIDVADWDADGLDEVISGAPAEFTYSYDLEVQSGAVLLLEEDLQRTALLHGEPYGMVGRTPRFVRGEDSWSFVAQAYDGEVRGGATYFVDLPAEDGARLDLVARARIPGTAGSLGHPTPMNARRLFSLDEGGVDGVYASCIDYSGTDTVWRFVALDASLGDLSEAPVLVRSSALDGFGLALARRGEDWWFESLSSPDSIGSVYRFQGPLRDATLVDATDVWLGGHDGAGFGVGVALLDDPTGTLLVVGAPGESTDAERAGRVYLFDAYASTQDPIATIHPDVASRLLGDALLAPGDLDGDGFDDLVVGAPTDQYTSDMPGVVYVFRGPLRGDLSVADADRVIRGTHLADRTGAGLASGDFDGDGKIDLLIGRPWYSPDATRPWVGRIDRVLNVDLGW